MGTPTNYTSDAHEVNYDLTNIIYDYLSSVACVLMCLQVFGA